MKSYFLMISIAIGILSACNNKTTEQTMTDNKELAAFFQNYYEERMKLFPLEATQNGDNRYNDRMPVEFTDSYRAELKTFFQNELDGISKFDHSKLNKNDQISYDIFKTEMETSLAGLGFHDNYTPFHQFWGLPLIMGQLGSGDGNQPFKTVEDYQNWTKRAAVFADWADSAIVYFKKGIAANYVLPATLVEKMIPQMAAMQSKDLTKSLFYAPVNKTPENFSKEEKEQISADYKKLISEKLNPAYYKLELFLKNEYLPKARKSSGVNDLKDGQAYYNYLIRYWTTTGKTTDEIYNKGLEEVKRIQEEIDTIQKQVGFKGTKEAFFEHIKNDPKLMPYKTPEDVLNAFRSIQSKIDPKLKTMFSKFPKTPFEIRQTEAYRAESASAEYNQGSADGTRPGIFYVPILDATKFNVTSGMESLFLHEAIPGHHYQISLQQENEQLPKFRRFSWYGAYGEGWALYCESLGKELGCYTDPYQYLGALGDEMHRAIRLVVDVALHTGKMNREQAIKYMTDNEAISEEGAIAEIERYMAIPGQALSYKIGALKIWELRTKYEKQLGSKFKLADFHDELLSDGCMPLDVIEKKMDDWAASQQ